MDAKTYLNNIRDKNDDNSVKYDKMISEIPYITNPKDLEKLKEILNELKTENKDLYDYIISLLKKTDDLNELFLLYKEYKEAKLREEVLDNEVRAKDIEFNNIKEDLSDKEDDLKDFDNIAKDLKSTGKILDDLSSTTSINLDRTFVDLEKEDAKRLGFGTKALLALGSFLAFKNNHNIVGTLLATYLSYKVLSELSSSNKNNYIDLCNEYIDSLETYKDNALEIEKNLVSNLDNIEKVESDLKTKYKAYLKESEFKRIFKIIDDIKDTVKYSLKDIDKTKDDIDRSIDNGKVKIKVMEG
ncbi:MAG TPA: hypothetical protein IAB38_07350 [Candidatus Onthousia excrementipullorum]|uniref:Uncharacterized protein n=1 Tax=Candidatus Onthousia excrementipullorum TaxID=2840884 RepID=A0A9D1DVD7_9FIRM|nr:hypothetical protein [Candidatus Onthousia excrementipullorum]